MSNDPYDEMRTLNSLIIDGYIKDPRLGGEPRPPVAVYPSHGIGRPQKKSPRISEVCELWMQGRRAKLSQSSIMEYDRTCNLFLQVMEMEGVETFGDLGDDNIRAFRNVLLKLPSNASKGKLKGLSLQELITLENVPRISPSTIKKYAVIIKTMLKYAQREKGIDCTRYIDVLSLVDEFTKEEKVERVDFNDEDIRQLFGHDKVSLPKYLSLKWGMLIALYTGMRQGEILQLTKADIIQVEGVWCISVNDDGDKTLKTESSKGIIPIAEKLIELGFLDYVRTRKDKLFDETRDVKGSFGAYGKRFNNFLKKTVGITVSDNKRKDFHSFRHTLRTRLSNIEAPEVVIDAILRHTNKDASTGAAKYDHSLKIVAKKKYLDQLIFPV